MIYRSRSSTVCPCYLFGFFRDCSGSAKLKVVFSLRQICMIFCFPFTNIVTKEKALKIVLTCCVQIWDAFQKWKVSIQLFLLLFLSLVLLGLVHWALILNPLHPNIILYIYKYSKVLSSHFLRCWQVNLFNNLEFLYIVIISFILVIF